MTPENGPGKMGYLKRAWNALTGRDSEGGAAVAPISCEEAVGVLLEYLDGELDPVAALQVQQHLEVCKACYPRARFEEAFLEAVEATREHGEVPPGLRDRIVAHLAEGGPEAE